MMGLPIAPAIHFASARRAAHRRETTRAGSTGRAWTVPPILLLQHPDRGRRREHRRHFVFLDQTPPDGSVGPRRQPFVQEGRHAGDERAVDDVAVTDDPADVAGGEVGLARPAHEDVLHARRQRHRIAAGVALHALGRPVVPLVYSV